ncbi:type II toxin-antitoxin system HigB family toxin [Pseudomonas daroniae]|uniref:Type II toxin-antitoxin system HigB family toxin n=1 Tax=Phytopseudomonas daroniae TaxID=2487519 RepID=A0A4Q9QNY7_9GAMM|nr:MULTISPECIES: type II toxin-antitoxin system HigB family toxin [Pseudomonas]TBU81909.1 type II toxin-antitoxin system HigB family toxin [Pseudomonas daroniae]TBU84754.1 type II toxin-antitoxin system HigB family toxin [Pseudomonas sp. FRB 228]TBU92211.1 type II toxin-antitoxin system HigB family toxin [Pseudomonas daroniae]
MHVITQKRIWEAKNKWPNTANALDAWYRLISKVELKDFAELKQLFPSVGKVANKHVFDIGGNKLRLIAVVDYPFKKVFIRDVLDHKEYDRNQWK